MLSMTPDLSVFEGNAVCDDNQSADPAQPFDRPMQLVGVDARIALRRVQVLVAT